MTLANIILQLSIWSILLPLAAGFIYFKQLDQPSHLIFIVVVLATIPQLLTLSMIHTQELNVVYNVYTLLEFLLLYFFIGRNFQRQIFNRIGMVTVGLFCLLGIWFVGKHGLYQKFLNELICVANCIYLAWIFMFILDGLLNEQKLVNPKLPLFWFLTGILFYAPCSIFVIALAHYIKQSTNPIIHNMWSVHGVFNILMYVFFAVGFYKSHLLMQRIKAEG